MKIKPKKSLGQNFLFDKNIINKIIEGYIKLNPLTEAKQKRIIDGIVKVLSKRK